jgi:hypothetical protein
MKLVFAGGLAFSLLFNLHFIEKLEKLTGVYAHCLNGGSFTDGHRVVNCLVVETHEEKRGEKR